MNVADFHAAQARRSKLAARLAFFAIGLMAIACACSY